jgi:regulation of enolase protein 1 (concanavalin A-like superfamily)
MFQQYVNKTLLPYLDDFSTAYLDNVLTFSQILEVHIQHVYQILGLLQQAGLQVKPQKYEFHKTTIEYPGMLVTPAGLKMDSSKVSTLAQWLVTP